MSHCDDVQKQPKRRSRAGIVLLIIFLLIAGGAGLLNYSVFKAPVTLDDPQKMAASAPMSVQERFQFSAADQTVQVRMDAADLWNLILEHTGNDILDVVNRELSSYGLRVSGCGIHLNEDGLRLNLELYYGETRLAVKVPCTLAVSGTHISLVPSEVKLGMISLPVKSILSSLKLEYELLLPVLSDVSQVSFEKNALLLTGSMKQDLYSLIPVNGELDYAAVFYETLKPLADALDSQEGYTAILNHLQKNPGDIQNLYRQMFILADAKVVETYLDSRHGMTQRFFPEIDFAAVSEESISAHQELTALIRDLEQFFTKAVNTYNNKEFKLSSGEFLIGKKSFQAAEFGKGEFDSLFEVLDPESFFLILVDAEDGFIRNTSSFYRIADEKQEFTQPVDFNKTYILGCVFRNVTGKQYLIYDGEISSGNTYSRKTVLKKLTQEEACALQVPGKFGVWSD